jgi:hypothetical protein
MTTPPIEIDQYTREGHRRFMSNRQYSYVCTDGKTRTLSEWLEWMKTWNPLTTNPDEAKKVLDARLDAEAKAKRENRGPGMQRRPVRKLRPVPSEAANSKTDDDFEMVLDDERED